MVDKLSRIHNLCVKKPPIRLKFSYTFVNYSESNTCFWVLKKCQWRFRFSTLVLTKANYYNRTEQTQIRWNINAWMDHTSMEIVHLMSTSYALIPSRISLTFGQKIVDSLKIKVQSWGESTVQLKLKFSYRHRTLMNARKNVKYLLSFPTLFIAISLTFTLLLWSCIQIFSNNWSLSMITQCGCRSDIH